MLFFGGQKSGKSLLAELKTIELSKEKKPYYIATYDNSYHDKEMQRRISQHKIQRDKKFITIEERHNLDLVIKKNQTYLVDCLSMWILNNMEKKEEALLEQLSNVSKIESNIVFVLNDVNSGIIPFDKESRKFVDLTGVVGQKVTSFCDEVYEVKLGLERRLK